MPKILQKGSALISALFIMTLVAIAATAMTLRLQQDIYKTDLTIQSDSLYLASQGVVFWAMGEIANPKNTFTEMNAKGQIANFPKKMQSLFTGIQVSGDLYDLQGLFNLANLQLPTNLQDISSFNNLVKQILSKPKSAQDAIFYALQDWQLPYDLGKGKDAYTSYYLSQNPPYYPSHQPMKSISEFRLLQDVSAQDYLKLLPFMTVLPERTPVNINTAPKPVLMSLQKDINESEVQEIIQARENGGINNLDKITPLLDKLKISTNQIVIASEYFLIVSTVSNQDLTLVNYTIIKRETDKNNRTHARIISQSLNTLP